MSRAGGRSEQRETIPGTPVKRFRENPFEDPVDTRLALLHRVSAMKTEWKGAPSHDPTKIALTSWIIRGLPTESVELICRMIEGTTLRYLVPAAIASIQEMLKKPALFKTNGWQPLRM